MLKNNFNDYVEVLNEKMITWNKKWISIGEKKLRIYDVKPSNLFLTQSR